MAGRTFAVVQADRDDRPTLADGRLGVIHPVNMDGFYADRDEAFEVATFMAEERPDLDTYLVQCVAKVGEGR